ncbi:MAG: hypothetical protein CMJ49_01510 [Planctomycetaceae bacterium]|nr:hypothetical protein [Planctomycetaceae bacterium]
MDYTLYIHITSPHPGRPLACGIQIIDDDAARPIHESGSPLTDTEDRHAAAFDALNHALDLIVPLPAQRVALCCDNELLTQQVTGATPITIPALAERFNQTMNRLLRLHAWQINTVDSPPIARATELADAAARQGHTIEPITFDQADHRREPHTGVPQWTVTCLEDPGARCPAPPTPHTRYPFGPDTPAGLCVHAARAALDDGPLHWPDPNQQRMTTVCPHCHAPIRIERVGAADSNTPLPPCNDL